VCQMTSTSDAKENFEQAKTLIKRAAEMGCSLVCLPENFAFLGEHYSQALRFAESIESGEWISQYKHLAKENRVWLSLGGFQHRISDEKLFNTHAIVDSQGNIVETYDKIHRFDVDLPLGISLKESRHTEAGCRVVNVKSPVGNLGLSVVTNHWNIPT